MNLADQIEVIADRAVADLVAARLAHTRRTRSDDGDPEADETDVDESDALALSDAADD